MKYQDKIRKVVLLRGLQKVLSTKYFSAKSIHAVLAHIIGLNEKYQSR
jgi:hypothetical protein